MRSMRASGLSGTMYDRDSMLNSMGDMKDEYGIDDDDLKGECKRWRSKIR